MARLNKIILGVLAAVLCGTAQAATLPTASTLDWAVEMQRLAIADGVSPETARAAFDAFVPDARVLELDQKQPEGTVTFATYRQRTVTAARVRKGRELMRRYEVALSEIEARTGVPPQMVVALWGIESSFGQNMGGFDTINALATLAYEGRRSAFFRGELLAALHIVDVEHLSVDDLRGSWAGAMGQCQFMPSTYLKYAVDGDGDGRRDIWNNPVDALASIAFYLAAEGWQRVQSWGAEVDGHAVAARRIPATDMGLAQTRSLSAWAQAGVVDFAVLTPAINDWRASLLQPDGGEGDSFLVTDNFRALMRWNHSQYFGLAVGLLADELMLDR